MANKLIARWKVSLETVDWTSWCMIGWAGPYPNNIPPFLALARQGSDVTGLFINKHEGGINLWFFFISWQVVRCPTCRGAQGKYGWLLINIPWGGKNKQKREKSAKHIFNIWTNKNKIKSTVFAFFFFLRFYVSIDTKIYFVRGFKEFCLFVGTCAGGYF